MYDVPTKTFTAKTDMPTNRGRFHMAGLTYVKANGDTVLMNKCS